MYAIGCQPLADRCPASECRGSTTLFPRPRGGYRGYRGERGSQPRVSPCFILIFLIFISAADRGLRAPLVLFSKGPLNLRRKRLLDVELSPDFIGGFVCVRACVGT